MGVGEIEGEGGVWFGASYHAAAAGRRRGAPQRRARRARNPDEGARGEGAVAGLADGAEGRGEAEATAMTAGAWRSGKGAGIPCGFLGGWKWGVSGRRRAREVGNEGPGPREGGRERPRGIFAVPWRVCRACRGR